VSLSATQRATPVSFEAVPGAIGCAEDESILLAGLRAGLNLPYQCASGGCGTCRAQLLDGTVASRWEAASGLSDRDRRKGDRILMCQSVPRAPCTIRVPVPTDPRPEPPPRRLTGRIAAREDLTADTARFVIEAARQLDYLPGQFVLLEFPDGTRRAYSMSRPADPGTAMSLDLLIRAKPGGAASTWLFERLSGGDSLVIEGPYGKAYAQSPPRRPVICLAGGTGLAPMLAIAEHLTTEAPARRLDLYVGARHDRDLVLAARLHALTGQGVRVSAVVEHGAGRPHPQLGPLLAGLALDHLAVQVPDLSQHDVYVAGPEPMIAATLRRLVRDGTARADRIFFDRFFS
jgi:toluene monooxygenase electron transfer component